MENTLELFGGLQSESWPWGGGDTGRIPASRPRSRPGKRWGTTMCSPMAWGWPELGRRTRWRGRVVKTGGGHRGGSAPAATGAWRRQRVAREGPIGSRKGAWVVARPWEAGGSAARRWRRGWRGRAAMPA
jgi:hypothetical protein